MRVNRNSLGFSLIEIVLALGLGAIIALFGLQLIKVTKDMDASNSSTHNIDGARLLISNTLKNKLAMRNTINAAANAATFACVKNNTDCAASGGPFILYDSNNLPVPIVAAPASADGFTYGGSACNSYSVAGSDSCPLRYDVVWTPRCPSAGPCTNPVLEFNAALSHSPGGKREITIRNLKVYDVHYSTVSNTLSSYDACMKAGGELNGVTGKCDLLVTKPLDCPPNYWIVGFLADHTPHCEPINGFSCPMGQVLLGFDTATLEAVCGPGCASGGSTRGGIW